LGCFKKNHNLKGEIVNRVQNSGLITLDLADYIQDSLLKSIDFKTLLQDELVLREKPFREFIKNHDWDQYKGMWVSIYSSVDAIIPSWAFMLISSSLTGIADAVVQCPPNELRTRYVISQIEDLDEMLYMDQRVIVKGCGSIPIPEAAYVSITQKLMPVVKSLMYGEACSAVPVYKKPK